MFSLATKFAPERSYFEMASQAGFQAVEFWLGPKILSEASSLEIVSLARQYPFRYAIHFPNSGPLTDEHLASIVRLYRELNCTATIIHQPMFKRYSSALYELAPEIVLAVENHDINLEDFHEWAEQNSAVTLDVEHLWKFTLHDGPVSQLYEELDRFLERHGKKLQHVHLLGYHPGGEEHRPVHHHPELIREVFSRLAAAGYSKLATSEADLEHQTLESLSKDVVFFREWTNANVV